MTFEDCNSKSGNSSSNRSPRIRFAGPPTVTAPATLPPSNTGAEMA